MKKSITLIFMLLFAVTLFSQSERDNQYFVNQEDMIEFDITDIDRFDERVYFIYNLSKDDRFLLTMSEDNGIFLISSSDDSNDLQEDFKSFNQETAEAFNKMSKDEAAELFDKYKEFLSNEIMNSMMMDVYIKSRQNNLCANAEPFCTDNGLYQFPAGVNAGSGESGPNYSCLSSTPNPAWYYMRIATPGNINIYMYSTPSKDIDFCCWGPFDDPIAPCPNGLTAAKVVSCSYSANPTETCVIPSSAQTGQYYILIITNYSNSTCNITFSKQSGTGTTDCSIMPPLISYNDPLCVGGNLILRAETIAGASYSWTGPGGWTSTQQNPTRTNVTTAMSGTYTCQIAVGSSQSDPISIDVVIYPDAVADFTIPTAVCAGTPMQFTSTSGTNPAGGTITSWNWTFGDGGTATGANVSHTYNTGGSYNVSLAVATNGECTDTKTQAVQVYYNPNAYAGPDQNIGYGGTATLTGTGGTGNFTYRWEPANKVTNPNAATTQTIALTQTTMFTLTVTSQQGNCVDTDQVNIAIDGTAMAANVSVEESDICEGETTILHATASGGAGNYSYSWSPTTGLSNPNIASPEASPTATTTYECYITDGVTSQDPQVTINVHPVYPAEHLYDSVCNEPGGHYNLYGFNIDISEPGSTYQTINLKTAHWECDSIVTMHLTIHPDVTGSFDDYFCEGYTYDFYGQQLNQAGTYNHTLTSYLGCDSIVTLNLSMKPSELIEIKESICKEGSYNFHGTIINGNEVPNDSAEYEYSYTTQFGCDGLEILTLVIKDRYEKTIDTLLCDENLVWDWLNGTDTVIETSGTYEHIFMSQVGCDSLVTYNFERLPDYDEANSNIIETYTACDNFTWHQYNYNSAGHYTEHNFNYGTVGHNCDSIVWLDLTLNESTESTIRTFACNEYTIEGQTFNHVDSEEWEHTIHTNNHIGCDSTINLFLTLYPSPVIKPINGEELVYIGGEYSTGKYSYTIDVTGPIASLHPEYIHYSWGHTNPYDWELADNINGDPKKITITVKRPGNDTIWCDVSTDNCETIRIKKYIYTQGYSIDEHDAYSNIVVKPNPTNGILYINFNSLDIDSKVNLVVYDSKGIRIDAISGIMLNEKAEISHSMSNYSNGLYFIEISTDEFRVVKKVIKE